MERSRRSNVDSRAGIPARPGRPFHLLRDDVVSVREEIVDAVYALGRTRVETASMLGEVWARLRAAGAGELVDSDDLSPVRMEPDLWELRWRFRGRALFRMYHAEPERDPDLVALLFHRKHVDGCTDDQVRGEQERQMGVAAARYTAGVARRWGHARSACIGCVDPDDSVEAR